jgi:hypothetical protein
MQIHTRMLVTLFLRLLLLFFAVWIAVVPDALAGADLVTRIGVAALFLVLAIFVGEVAGLRAQLDMLLHALRTATSQGAGPDVQRDDRAAVDILIRALESRDEETRQKALKNLRRLTGQDLPGDRQAWEAWWKDHRDAFRGRPGG